MNRPQTSDPILHPVAIAQVMINFAVAQGADAATCLAGTGIGESTLASAEALITREQEMRLMENLMLALPDVPALGFELGLQYSIATFGSWGFLMRTSRNLQEAIKRTLNFLPLSTAYCQIQLIREPDTIGVAFQADRIPRQLRTTMLERDMATAIQLLREMGLAGIPLQALTFAHQAPAYADRLETLAGIRPIFDYPRHSLLLSRADAERPLPTYDAQLVSLLEDQCRQQLARRQPGGWVARTRQQMLGPQGFTTSIETIAQALNLSTRSLRRRLEAEGTGFRELLEQERQQLACQLLSNTRMTLDEIAVHLGYGDTSSFTRAFRRWFGEAPGVYRSRKSTPGATE